MGQPAAGNNGLESDFPDGIFYRELSRKFAMKHGIITL